MLVYTGMPKLETENLENVKVAWSNEIYIFQKESWVNLDLKVGGDMSTYTLLGHLTPWDHRNRNHSIQIIPKLVIFHQSYSRISKSRF